MRDVPGVRPSWSLDRDDNLTLLDEEVMEASRTRLYGRWCETMRSQRGGKIVLGIVRQFGEMSGWS